MVTKNRTYVSRGGEKLSGILHDLYQDEESIKEHLQDLVALDIGSSTGGFTDCLLRFGVREVTAVDVGTNQLHTTLRHDPRIHLFENTDIRTFITDTTFDLIVADLSFIPLEKVTDAIFRFAHSGSILILLIKPQFEVGKGNTKKGIVKDKALVQTTLLHYAQMVKEQGYEHVGTFLCHIKGGDGNQEYFLVATKK
jgi:23S rRNA (cytidine1920-2'-O)/16S rRNA (cytidine1409-2'-O)-methyltransferase